MAQIFPKWTNRLPAMMIVVPASTLLYILVSGLGEMLMLGILYGLTLKPSG